MLGSNPGYATWFLFFYFEGFVSLFRLLLGGGVVQTTTWQGCPEEETTFTPPLPPWRGRQNVWVQPGAPTCKCQLKAKGGLIWECTSLWGPISCQAQRAQEPGSAPGSEAAVQPGQSWLTQWHLGA